MVHDRIFFYHHHCFAMTGKFEMETSAPVRSSRVVHQAGRPSNIYVLILYVRSEVKRLAQKNKGERKKRERTKENAQEDGENCEILKRVNVTHFLFSPLKVMNYVYSLIAKVN